MTFLLNSLLFIFSFFGLWLSSQLIIDGINRFSKSWNISAFSASFVILGLLTSIPELAVGINSIIDKKPEIFVGDLAGASFVLFLFIIPILAIFGNGLKLSHSLSQRNLLFALFVILIPMFSIIDGTITVKGAALMIILYGFLVFFMEKKKGLLEAVEDKLMRREEAGLKDFGKVVVGAIMIFLSSKLLVDETLYLGSFFKIEPYFISLVILSVGTNLPELVIAIRSVLSKNTEVAFGDYIGSAAANTLLFGVFSLINGQFTVHNGGFVTPFILFAVGLVLFYIFARTKAELSRVEGAILLMIYVIFLINEIVVTKW